MAKTGFQVGELIENRYRVLDMIGSGGMGTLYRVSDEARDGEIVALKTVTLDIPAARMHWRPGRRPAATPCACTFNRETEIG